MELASGHIGTIPFALANGNSSHLTFQGIISTYWHAALWWKTRLHYETCMEMYVLLDENMMFLCPWSLYTSGNMAPYYHGNSTHHTIWVGTTHNKLYIFLLKVTQDASRCHNYLHMFSQACTERILCAYHRCTPGPPFPFPQSHIAPSAFLVKFVHVRHQLHALKQAHQTLAGLTVAR